MKNSYWVGRFVAICVLVLSCPGLAAQEDGKTKEGICFFDEGEVVRVSDGMQWTFRALDAGSELEKELLAYCRAMDPYAYAPREIVYDMEQVMQIVGDEVQFDHGLHFGSFNSITCRNGRRIDFPLSVGLEYYFPDCDIIVLGPSNPFRAIRLTTGEEAYVVEHIHPLGRRNRILAARYLDSEPATGDLRLVIQQRGKGKWETIADVTEWIGTPTRRDLYQVKENKLYMLLEDRWWHVDFKKQRTR